MKNMGRVWHHIQHCGITATTISMTTTTATTATPTTTTTATTPWLRMMTCEDLMSDPTYSAFTTGFFSKCVKTNA